VQRKGSKVSIWGLVRPASPLAFGPLAPTPISPPGAAPTTATIFYADRGSSRFKVLRNVRTDSRGYFTFSSRYRAGRRWNVRWQNFIGTPVGSYRRP
jgi:hypothetical protein